MGKVKDTSHLVEKDLASENKQTWEDLKLIIKILRRRIIFAQNQKANQIMSL